MIVNGLERDEAIAVRVGEDGGGSPRLLLRFLHDVHALALEHVGCGEHIITPERYRLEAADAVPRGPVV